MVGIEELSLKEKIGQMIIIGLDTENPKEPAKEVITKYNVGGVLLYKKNYKNINEMIELINYIKELNKNNKVPLWIAVDQEGGRVNRMPPDLKNFVSQFKLASYEKEDLISKEADITGEMLSKIGINMNFAPVLDVKRFADNHAIGDRAFSNDINKITILAKKYIENISKHNVLPIIKHFPGHSAIKNDTHYFISRTSKTMEELENEDMKPFVELMKNKADAVLLSHILVKGEKKPVSMSKNIIENWIRGKLKYNGLIVTDDMRMKGIQILYGKKTPIIDAFEAGNDIILFKYQDDNKIFDKILKKVEKENIDINLINESVRRILNAKEKYNVHNNKINLEENFIDNINNKIENINKLCNKF